MFTTSQVARFGITITTVDPSQGLVKGVMKGDSQERSITINDMPSAFRWPREGEIWVVEQKNGTWYLEGAYPSSDVSVTIQDIDPGDLVLTTPTGVVRVLGSEDGSTDFILTKTVIPKRLPHLTFGGDLTILRTHNTTKTNMVTL